MSILVTGGAGFIGANFVLDWVKRGDETVINLDKRTYIVGTLHLLESVRAYRSRMVPNRRTPSSYRERHR